LVKFGKETVKFTFQQSTSDHLSVNHSENHTDNGQFWTDFTPPFQLLIYQLAQNGNFLKPGHFAPNQAKLN
jgi:hypothetical protein